MSASGYSVTVPLRGSLVRQARLGRWQWSRYKGVTPAIGFIPGDSYWHRSSGDATTRQMWRGVWRLRTLCGRTVLLEPKEPTAPLGIGSAVRWVVETVEFPAGRVCSRCQRQDAPEPVSV